MAVILAAEATTSGIVSRIAFPEIGSLSLEILRCQKCDGVVAALGRQIEDPGGLKGSEAASLLTVEPFGLHCCVRHLHFDSPTKRHGRADGNPHLFIGMRAKEGEATVEQLH
jgi:hypothetical protein